jgi:putative phosphoribosyl transferase
VLSDSARELGISPEKLRELVERERLELQRRVYLYRGDRPLPTLAARDVVLVDDGLATGITAEAAINALRNAKPDRVVLAVPVAAPDTVDRLAKVADEVVALETPRHFSAVGQWYQNFSQVTDREVIELLGPR